MFLVLFYYLCLIFDFLLDFLKSINKDYFFPQKKKNKDYFLVIFKCFRPTIQTSYTMELAMILEYQ